jgi:hypothetical protein
MIPQRQEALYAKMVVIALATEISAKTKHTSLTTLRQRTNM